MTGSVTGVRQPIAPTVLLANGYRPVGYGAGPLLSIGKNTLLHLANRSARQVGGRPIGQQEIDDKVNSEIADVDSKVAGGFIMILNIADEIIT